MNDDDDSEQRDLEGKEAEITPRTLQEKIIHLYNSDNFRDVIVGYWAKLLVETVIVGGPVGFFVLIPGFYFAYHNIGPFTYINVFTGWIVLSTSILNFSWCLTEPSGLTGDDNPNNASEDIQD